MQTLFSGSSTFDDSPCGHSLKTSSPRFTTASRNPARTTTQADATHNSLTRRTTLQDRSVLMSMQNSATLRRDWTPTRTPLVDTFQVVSELSQHFPALAPPRIIWNLRHQDQLGARQMASQVSRTKNRERERSDVNSSSSGFLSTCPSAKVSWLRIRGERQAQQDHQELESLRSRAQTKRCTGTTLCMRLDTEAAQKSVGNTDT